LGDILATGSPDEQERMGTIALPDLHAPNQTPGNYGLQGKRAFRTGMEIVEYL